MAVPLSVAIPATAASLAYLNARFSLFYDNILLGGLFKSTRKLERAAARGQLNSYYILEAHAQSPKTADRAFLVYQGQEWTYKEAYDIVLRHGAWLKNKHGVAKGEIIAIDFMNSPTFIWLLFGLWSIGAKPALLNYNLTGKPLLHCIKTSTARLLFGDPEIRHNFTPEVQEEISSHTFLERGGSVETIFTSPDIEAEILANAPTREPDSLRAGDLPHHATALIYTSGTTGFPKPAVVSLGRTYRGGYFTANFLGMKQSDRFYTAMPLYHSSALLVGFGPTLATGATFVLSRKFSTRTFWDEVRASKATMIQYVGETLRYLLAAPPTPLDKVHNVRLAFGNGLRPDVWERFKSRFGIETIAEFYGATEAPGAFWNRSSNSLSSGAQGRSGGISRLLSGLTYAVVELDSTFELPARDPKTGLCKRVRKGDPGELLMKLDPAAIEVGFQGYLNNKSATEKKIFRDVFQKGDAWFDTGDMMRYTKDGLWYFVDRLGDTYRWKSENVSTAEVADAIGMHPAIVEACVYGVQLPGYDGRAGCAAVILKSDVLGDKAEPEEAVLRDLAAHANTQLPRYAVPIFLRLTKSLETTGTNKQQKHVLREQGVDPAKVAEEDKIFWLQDGTYRRFGEREWNEMTAGRAKL